MEPDQIDTDLSKALCELFGIVLFREAAAAVEVGAPEFDMGAVLKDKVTPLHFQKAVLACGLLTIEDKGDTHRYIVMEKRIGNELLHFLLLLY